MELSMSKKDTKGGSGGFVLTNRKKVCEFILLNGDVRSGCIVVAES
jgi:hypothetical protein